jgi:hypothetical protein
MRDLIIVTLIIYTGVVIQVLPKMLYGGRIYIDEFMNELMVSFGGLIVIAGVIMFFANRSEKRIISSLKTLDELNQLGIDRIANLTKYSLSEITDRTHSYQKVDILISYHQVNKNIRYLIEQLVEKKDSPKIRILVCGTEANKDSDAPIMQQIASEQRALSEVIRRFEESKFKNLSLRFSKTNVFHSVIFTESSICLFLPHEPSGRAGLVTYLNHRSDMATSYSDLFESLWGQATDNLELLG